MKTNTRQIHTGLFTNTAASILASVLGQESDGIWENSRGHERYWRFAGICRAKDDEVLIEVSDGIDTYYHCASFFNGKTDYEVCEYFANRIKQIAKIEMKDEHVDGVSGWNRNNSRKLCYLHDARLCEAYLVYEILKGRSRARDKYATDLIEKVIGHRLTPEAIALREVIKKINAKLADDLKALEAKHAADVSALKAAAEAEISKLKAA